MNNRLEYLLGKYRFRSLTPDDEVELRGIVVAEAPEFKDSPIGDVVAYGLVAVGMKVLFSLFEDRVAELSPRGPPEPKPKRKIYVVTVNDCESTSIRHIHKTMEGALETWNCTRLELIEDCKRALERHPRDEMYQRMVCCLEDTNPQTIDNWPHDTPNITEYELED
jgi:hypothetical protein